jgi:hypothetical protein
LVPCLCFKTSFRAADRKLSSTTIFSIKLKVYALSDLSRSFSSDFLIPACRKVSIDVFVNSSQVIHAHSRLLHLYSYHSLFSPILSKHDDTLRRWLNSIFPLRPLYQLPQTVPTPSPNVASQHHPLSAINLTTHSQYLHSADPQQTQPPNPRTPPPRSPTLHYEPLNLHLRPPAHRSNLHNLREPLAKHPRCAPPPYDPKALFRIRHRCLRSRTTIHRFKKPSHTPTHRYSSPSSRAESMLTNSFSACAFEIARSVESGEVEGRY